MKMALVKINKHKLFVFALGGHHYKFDDSWKISNLEMDAKRVLKFKFFLSYKEFGLVKSRVKLLYF